MRQLALPLDSGRGERVESKATDQRLWNTLVRIEFRQMCWDVAGGFLGGEGGGVMSPQRMAISLQDTGCSEVPLGKSAREYEK